MGRSTAENVLQTFLAGISDPDQSKILQVASDGRNVNVLFLKNLAVTRGILIQKNPLDKNIRKNPESVDIAFAAKHKLEQIKFSLNSAKIMEFKKQAGDFLAQLFTTFQKSQHSNMLLYVVLYGSTQCI